MPPVDRKPPTRDASADRPSRGRVGVLAFALAAAALVGHPDAYGLTPAELVGPDLQPQVVSLAGIRDGRISFFDQDRRLRNEPTGNFVQIRNLGIRPGNPQTNRSAVRDARPQPADPDAADQTIRLLDGQKLTGQWMGGDAAGSAIRFHHHLLGVVDLPLDDVAALSPADAPAPSRSDLAIDRITLLNGDQVTGFITRVLPDSVDIEPAGGEPLSLPRRSVRAIRFGNPPSEAHRPGVGEQLVVFRDGSRLLGGDLQITSDHLAFRPRIAGSDAAPLVLPLDDIARVDLVGSGWLLVDLASQRLRVTDGGEVFGVPMPPRTEAGDVLMNAPVAVEVALPPTATRLAATALLDLDAATVATDWADFEIIIPAADERQPAHRYRLNAENPVASINIPLAGLLQLRLDPGINGPILDRLRLTDAQLLLHDPIDEE
jgi:hypothetical protein